MIFGKQTTTGFGFVPAGQNAPDARFQKIPAGGASGKNRRISLPETLPEFPLPENLQA